MAPQTIMSTAHFDYSPLFILLEDRITASSHIAGKAERLINIFKHPKAAILLWPEQ